MNDVIRLKLPLDEAVVRSLKAGDRVELTGVLWTGRDAAHRRWLEMLDRGEKLPIDLRGQTIYFVGPCPARPGMPIGSAGPTTSGRMDAYSPRVMRELGIRGKYEVTAPDGKKLPALEYRSAPDGKLLYVINWNKAVQQVKLPAGRWRELISETDSPRTFELKPLEVRLFRRQ